MAGETDPGPLSHRELTLTYRNATHGSRACPVTEGALAQASGSALHKNLAQMCEQSVKIVTPPANSCNSCDFRAGGGVGNPEEESASFPVLAERICFPR